MNILLLRNQEERQSSENNIKKYCPHMRIFHAPLFQVAFEKLPQDVGENPLIITSKNALRSLKEADVQPKQPLFVLGASSNKMAKNLGFKDVIFGGLNAHQLAETIKEYSQLYHHLNYLHGDVVRFDIKDYLQRFSEQHVNKIQAYRLETITEPFAALPASFWESRFYVLFYSKRQVMQLTKHVHDLSSMKAICISPSVFDYASQFPFASLKHAKNPTEIAMLEEIKNQ